MKKHLLLLLIISYAATMLGQDVSESLAVAIATQYYEIVKDDNMNERVCRIKTINQIKNDRVPELISPLGLAEMWLVPVEDGWVLVSTNTKTTPVLAHYRTDRKPIFDSLAPGAKYLLECYEHEIAYANDSCSHCEQHRKWNSLLQDMPLSIRQTRQTRSVEPFIYTHWAQTNNWNYPYSICDKSYNKFCPQINNASNQCNKAAAGCAAVAMAQIMAYWHWPYAAYVPTTPGGNSKELKFYDWTMMPSHLYNTSYDDEVDMVTGLLRDCGYMADMNYGVGSGTTDGKVRDAMIAFGYNENTIAVKNKWQTSGWQTMLQAELNERRPVIYGGYSNAFGADGHYFILDGYNSYGHFHINFGWISNSADGFYQIDSITHENVNFNHWQSAIIGIQPKPICQDINIINILTTYPNFNYTSSGEMVLANNVMENVERGELFSATQVRLTDNVHIKSGCNVHIAIKDVPCQSSIVNNLPAIQQNIQVHRNAIQNEQDSVSVTSSSVQKILRDNQLLIHRGDKTYDAQGREVNCAL